MKLMITGGAGYLGSVLTGLALTHQCEVIAVDALWYNNSVPLSYLHNPGYRFIKADVADILNNRELFGGIDYIIHTAAVVGEPASNKFPDLTRKVNYDTSCRLIDTARASNVKGFIFLSTCSNYGVADGLATEESPLKPLSLYAETKINVERYLMEMSGRPDWVICRLSTLYGSSPRMRLDLTVNDFTMNAYMKKYLDVFLPYTYRPYIHVYDAARTIMKIVETFQDVKNDVFNVGFNSENYQKIAIAETIREYLPDTKVEVVDKGSDLRDYRVDFSKLEDRLNMKRNYGVNEGVREIISIMQNGVVTDPYEGKYFNTNITI